MRELVFKLFFAFAISLLIIAKSVNLIFAFDMPNFGICPNPGGTLIAQSDSGVYSIAGDPETHTGSDAIFGITNINLAVTQCFCPTTGVDGIQTDWWDVSGLTQQEITNLEASGWIYIANGADWGLNSHPYLALNSAFSCSSATPIPTPTPTQAPSNPGAPICTDSKPGTPFLLSTVRNGTSETITWSPVTPVSYYAIFYGTDANNFQYGVPNVGNGTSFTIHALNPNLTYYF